MDPSFPFPKFDAAEQTVAETVEEGYSSKEIPAETAGESEIEADAATAFHEAAAEVHEPVAEEPVAEEPAAEVAAAEPAFEEAAAEPVFAEAPQETVVEEAAEEPAA